MAKPGDVILLKGTLYVMKNVAKLVSGHLITVENDHTIEVNEGQAFSIYRIEERKS